MDDQATQRDQDSPGAGDQPGREKDGVVQDDAVIGVALRRSLLVLVSAGVAGVVVWVATQPAPPVIQPATPAAIPTVRQAPQAQPPRLSFTDVTQAHGITFEHFNGATGEKLLPETMGSGCAFLDFDNDQDQDIILVNSSPWPWTEPTDPPKKPTIACYQNDGQGSFRDVTKEVGLDVTLYGMGLAVGDYDNDGWSDVFISAVGGNRLFHNQQGKFVDVTGSSGLETGPESWSTSCGWFDYDRDGRLDLFVCQYIQWSREIDLKQDFRLVGVGRAYGPPMSFAGTFCLLYHNEGDGKFTDVSEKAGIQVRNPATQVPAGKSLGIVFVDLDQDHWPDIVVANDTVQNFVFRNQQDGTFEEIGSLTGVAFDPTGNSRGAMGIDTTYFRNGTALGVVIGNFANEMTAVYVAPAGQLQFTDEAVATGLGPASRLDLKFGLLFVDIDLDGRADVLTNNGHLEEEINKVQVSQHYAQPPHVFWNCGPEEPTEFMRLAEDRLGTKFLEPLVGRGLACADIDSDGDLDFLLTANGGTPRLLRNNQTLGHHWLRVKLTDPEGQRDAFGAVVTVKRGQDVQRQIVSPTRSYLSQCESTLTFGLGSSAEPVVVEVSWPDGGSETIAVDRVDRLLAVSRTKTK